MLAPGGTLLFAGEPSRYGDRLARVPKRFAGTRGPAVAAPRCAPVAPARRGTDRRRPPTRPSRAWSTSTPSPRRTARARARGGPSARARESARSSLANWFGWTNRTLEATAEPTDVPWAWRQYAYRGYLVLQELDRRPAGVAAAGRDLLQPDALRAQAPLSSPHAGAAPFERRAARQDLPLHLDSGQCPTDSTGASRCSRWGSWRCRPRTCRCTSSRTATAR